MSDSSDKRHQTMLKKFGDEEGLKEYYRELQKKSREHPNNRKGRTSGGFKDRELARRAGELGRAKRYGKNDV